MFLVYFKKDTGKDRLEIRMASVILYKVFFFLSEVILLRSVI